MIDRLLHWSLTHRPLVLAFAALLLVFGVLTAQRAPIDVFPDLTAPTVTVLTEARTMAPEELETRVTFPIEAVLNGASGVRRVRSTTGVGISVVYAEFEWGTDVFRARQVVNEKLQLVRDSLPQEVSPPFLAPVASIMGEILFVAVTHEGGSAMDARTYADFTLRRRLLAIPGVAQVIVIGGDRKQFEVAVSPERMVAYGVTPIDVVRALEDTNTSVSAGFIDEGGQEYLVQGVGRVRSLADVAQTMVTMRGDEPILVQHLAEVGYGVGLKRGVGSFGAAPAVIVGIYKQPGANTLDLTGRIDAELDALAEDMPAGLALQRDVFRQADFITVAVANVLRALRDGVFLVVCIVLIFLASGRASAITVAAIPLSLLVAILVLSAMGRTLDTMLLGGMAIAVGELVDDAVIDVENVVRRLRQEAALPAEERRPALVVVHAASREIRSSIVFATLVVVVTFFPLFFLSGVEGRLLLPLGLAYVVSLGASLLVAVTVTPVLCSYVLPGSYAVARARPPAFTRWLERAYIPVLDVAIRRWRALLLASGALLGLAALTLLGSGRAFLPEFREGTLTIAAVTLPGTSLTESDNLARELEHILLRQPEVVRVARRTGRAELDEHAQGVHASEIDVTYGQASRSREAFLAALRREFTAVPGMNVTIGQPIGHRIDHMLSGTRANIAVKVFGDDLVELRRLSRQIEDTMRGIPGVVDLVREQQTDIPYARVRFNRAAIARHGLRIADVAAALEVSSGVHVVSQVVDGSAVFDLVVRSATHAERTIDALADTLVTTPRGARLPLRALAQVSRDRGPNEIGREGVQRKLVVSCNVSGRDVVGVAEDIRAAIDREVTLPRGTRVTLGGQFESARSATRMIALLGLLSIVIIVGLLQAAFQSTRDAVLILVNLPLALIGGALGVWLSGNVLSVASLVGFVTLFGIATRNGIMLVAHIRHIVVTEGEPDVTRAVHRGATERLAPILMTALATALGLVPLALSGGAAGSEIQTPMAIVILCGLTTSTALNALVVPALYLRFGELSQMRRAPKTIPRA